MADAKIPPHSDNAEQSVLGAVLLDRDAVVVVEFLRPEHFYAEKHQKIFEAILDLYQEREPIDVVSVTERLKKQKVFAKIGPGYLADLVNMVPTAAHAEHYGHLVKDMYTKRMLISAAGKITEIAFDDSGDVRQILDQAESTVFSLSQQHLAQVFIPVKEILADSFDRLDELHKAGGALRGVPTGFAELDNLLAGMQNSNLLILAARPGMGKTALALNVAMHAAVKHKMPVGFFALEMSKEEMIDRLLVNYSEIDAWKMKTGRLDDN
ncbi:MAG: replicative DNA helicase, partial [candidate division Zixibacteria bacterium]|nr:replicative DNA helicase [candidate division Zixibacteria bacterium]